VFRNIQIDCRNHAKQTCHRQPGNHWLEMAVLAFTKSWL
jgi:hypothetical protein